VCRQGRKLKKLFSYHKFIFDIYIIQISPQLYRVEYFYVRHGCQIAKPCSNNVVGKALPFDS